MRLEDLQLVFRSSSSAPSDAQTYVVSLLNKFEVALTWDSRTLLIPSLLPTEEQTIHGPVVSDVRVKVIDFTINSINSNCDLLFEFVTDVSMRDRMPLQIPVRSRGRAIRPKKDSLPYSMDSPHVRRPSRPGSAIRAGNQLSEPEPGNNLK